MREQSTFSLPRFFLREQSTIFFCVICVHKHSRHWAIPAILEISILVDNEAMSSLLWVFLAEGAYNHCYLLRYIHL